MGFPRRILGHPYPSPSDRPQVGPGIEGYPVRWDVGGYILCWPPESDRWVYAKDEQAAQRLFDRGTMKEPTP